MLLLPLEPPKAAKPSSPKEACWICAIIVFTRKSLPMLTAALWAPRVSTMDFASALGPASVMVRTRSLPVFCSVPLMPAVTPIWPLTSVAASAVLLAAKALTLRPLVLKALALALLASVLLVSSSYSPLAVRPLVSSVPPSFWMRLTVFPLSRFSAPLALI